MIRLFCGYDDREAVGFHVFLSSVLRRASLPVFFTPIQDKSPSDGSNAFTYARFSVAEMCGYEGWAMFADSCDMLCLGDIADLWSQRNDAYAVQVVKHAYRTRNPIKYLGTTMQCPNVDYPRKNWSSVMLINCAAPEWKSASREGKKAHQFVGFSDSRIGDISSDWNVLADEGQPTAKAKLLHWTAGIPGFPIYSSAESANLWHEEHDFMRQCNV